MQVTWKQKICDAFKRDLQALRAQHNSVKSHRSIGIYPYLRVLKVPIPLKSYLYFILFNLLY